MNIKNIVAGVVLFSAFGAAMAEAPYPAETTFVSTKTRAEVIAELQQARAQGLLQSNDHSPEEQNFKSTKTRAQVINELKVAQQEERDHPLSYADMVSLH